MTDTNGSPPTNLASATQPPLLAMRGITKSFPGVQALREVDFDVRPGEVHALVGENGAGKSTLMEIVSGVYELDSGEITFKGQPAAFRNPRQSQLAGITTIYQELNQVPYLSVVVTPENLQDYLDGKLWTEPVAGLPEIDNDLPTVPD